MLHIPGKYLTIIQVENDALEPVFEFLTVRNIGKYLMNSEIKFQKFFLFADFIPKFN